MKKFFVHFFLLFAAFNAFSEAKVILEKDGVSFTDEELVAAFLDQSPEYQRAMIEKEDMLNNFLKRLFVSRMVTENEGQGLLKNKDFLITLKLSNERDVHQGLVKKKYLEKIKDIDFEKLAETEYSANKDKYKTLFSVDFYHVLFLKHNNLSDIDPKQKAEEVLAEIKDKKITMAEAAKKYGMPIAGVNEEGVVEKAMPESLMSEIKKVISKQKVGDVSDVIETGQGFHLVSLMKVDKPETLKFDKKLSDRIVASLKENLQSNIVNEVSLPYQDINTYNINRENLAAIYEKIKQGKL